MFFSIVFRDVVGCTGLVDRKRGQRIDPAPENANMRLIVLIPALFVFAGPAVGQDWQEYSYPDQGVAFQLPAAPSVQDTTAATPPGVTAPV